MKRFNVGVLLQQCPYNIALHALPFAVDQTHFVKAGCFALVEIFLHNAANFFGLKCMEIEAIFDGKNDYVTDRRVESGHRI